MKPAEQASTASCLDLEGIAPRPEWPRPIHAGVAILVVVAHVVARHADFTAVAGVWAGLTGAITYLAMARYSTLWPARLPTLEIVLGLLYGQLGLPITVQTSEIGIWDVSPSKESYETAALIGAACAVTLTLGFFLAVGGNSNAPKTFLPKTTPERVAKAASIFIPISATWVLATASSRSLRDAVAPVIAIIDGLLGKAPLAVTATILLLLMPSALNRVRLGLALTVLAAGMLITSLLLEAVLPMATAAAIFWRARKKTPIVLPAIAVSVLLLLQPVKGTYRQLHWYGDYNVVDAWTEAFLQRQESGDDQSNATEATRSRMGELAVLAYTVEMVPRVIPHTGGKAYPVVLAALVPRFIWPDKPNLTKAGTDVFTITLGIQTEAAADRSAVGLSIPPHGYLEHGVLGALGWMFIVGVVFGAVTRLFGPSLPGTVAVGMLTFGLAYSSAGGLVYFLGSVIQACILATAFVWFLHWLGGLGRAGAQVQRPRSSPALGGHR